MKDYKGLLDHVAERASEYGRRFIYGFKRLMEADSREAMEQAQEYLRRDFGVAFEVAGMHKVQFGFVCPCGRSHAGEVVQEHTDVTGKGHDDYIRVEPLHPDAAGKRVSATNLFQFSVLCKGCGRVALVVATCSSLCLPEEAAREVLSDETRALAMESEGKEAFVEYSGNMRQASEHPDRVGASRPGGAGGLFNTLPRPERSRKLH